MGDREADGVERPPAAVSPVTSARHPGAMGSRGRSARRGCHRGDWRTLVATSSNSSPVGVEVPHVCPAVREVSCSNRFAGYGCAARGSRSTGPQPPPCARPPRDFGPCCGLTSGDLLLSHTSSCVWSSCRRRHSQDPAGSQHVDTSAHSGCGNRHVVDALRRHGNSAGVSGLYGCRRSHGVRPGRSPRRRPRRSDRRTHVSLLLRRSLVLRQRVGHGRDREPSSARRGHWTARTTRRRHRRRRHRAPWLNITS